MNIIDRMSAKILLIMYLLSKLGFVPEVKFREHLCSRSRQTSGNPPNSGESGYGFGTKLGSSIRSVPLSIPVLPGERF